MAKGNPSSVKIIDMPSRALQKIVRDAGYEVVAGMVTKDGVPVREIPMDDLSAFLAAPRFLS